MAGQLLMYPQNCGVNNRERNMDTSEGYTRMCDCDEVQGEWKVPKDDDLYAWRGIVDEVAIFGLRRLLAKETADYVWLPRQDQIQEMMGWTPGSTYAWLYEGVIGFKELWTQWSRYVPEQEISDYMKLFNSFEQLWLAFYMYEKHGKTWDGAKWVPGDG